MNRSQALIIAVLVIVAMASAWVTSAIQSSAWRVTATTDVGKDQKSKAGQGLWETCTATWSTSGDHVWMKNCSGLVSKTLTAAGVSSSGKTDLTISRVGGWVASLAIFIALVLAIAGLAAYKNGNLHIATTAFIGLGFVGSVVALGSYTGYVSKLKSSTPLPNQSYGSAFASIIIGGVLTIPAFVLALLAGLHAKKHGASGGPTVSSPTSSPPTSSRPTTTFSPDATVTTTPAVPLPTSHHTSHVA